MDFLADVKFGARMLVKSPAFSLAAVGAIGLGIGVNSMMFTIYNAAFFKSLPFESPKQVVHVHSRSLSEGWEGRGFYYEDFLVHQAESRSFSGLAAFMGNSYRLADDAGMVQSISGCLVTPGLFALLGARPMLGRDFRAEDARPGSPKTALISYGLWQSRFGGDGSIVGRQIRLSSQLTTIIGVMPPGMMFPRTARIWVPIVDTPENRESFYQRHGFYMVGRLSDGTTPQFAESELRRIAARIEAGSPRASKGVEPVVLPFVEWDVRPKDKLMGQIALGAVLFVLLIACTNVANLLLSRAVDRMREVSIRIALGATRFRVISQLLTESLLLSVLGGALGLLLAVIMVKLFVLAIQPLGLPYWIDWSMDGRSLAYLMAISVASGILFGLAPALHISSSNVTDGLQEAGRQSSGGMRGRFLTSGLVVLEISLTLVLMVGGGLMVRSLLAMQGADLGLETRNLLSLHVPLDESRYKESRDRRAFADRLEARLRAHPDVASVTVASSIPAGGASMVDGLIVEGSLAESNQVAMTRIGDGYFHSLGLTMVRGREFGPTDGTPGAEVVIVNERFVARHWPDSDPIGKRIRSANGPRTVIGVSPNIRQTSLRREVDPLVYTPFRDQPPFYFSMLVRTRSMNQSVAKAMREEMRQLDPELPSAEIASMDEHIDRLSLETRIIGLLFSVFALMGLFLSALGIYAVIAHATSRRTREFGIRIALGASRGDVLRLVLLSGLKHLAIALPIGIVVALAVSRLFESVLFEVTPMDPVTFLAIPFFLSAVVLLACLIPARKASQLSPVDALRTE